MLAGVLVFSTGCRKEAELEKQPPSQQPAVSTPVNNYNANVPLQWYNLYLEVERYADGFRPPVSARALAYIGLSGYEAGVSGMPDNESMDEVFPGLDIPDSDIYSEYHWPTAINAAYARSMRLYFPHVDTEYGQDIENLEDALNNYYEGEMSEEVYVRSRVYGVEVANAIFQWAQTDETGKYGYMENHPVYNPPSCVGCWQPTGPDYTPALLPFWGNARTFAMSGQDFEIEPPLPFTEDENSALYVQAMEVYELYPLEYEDQWIAEFWSDDIFELTCTPVGRWVSIANQAAQQYEVDLEEALELYAKLGLAMNDAGVSCWYNKYEYDVARPSDFIKEYIDSGWETHLITMHDCLNPPFPAYPSGHAAFSSAAAGVLESHFGSSVSFTDNSHEDRDEFMGMPRTYSSWHEMAVENAYSRIPLGVHYQMDADAGVDLGYVASDRVLELPWGN